jgi:hypothetical protein
LREHGGVFLNVDFVGKGEIGFEKPCGKITEGSQRKFVYGIIIKDIVKRSENIKDDYRNTERDNKGIFIGKLKKIKKVFVPAGINRIRIRCDGNKGHYDRNPGGFNNG